jgi:hypothetical protein
MTEQRDTLKNYLTDHREYVQRAWGLLTETADAFSPFIDNNNRIDAIRAALKRAATDAYAALELIDQY